MRITNAMMSNVTLININRNMRRLDALIQQIESTKKIQVPSDDPIIASRALKFRTSVSETEQFQRNVQSGLSWMNVTESSFTDITQNLLKQIMERCVEGATGTEEYPDKMAIITEIRELVSQIGLDMNQTYAGRYVFSGFRTDQPPIYTENNNLSYVISQQFDLRDIEKIKTYQKNINEPGYDSAINSAIVHEANILKLAYQEVNFNFMMPDENQNPLIVPGIQGGGEPPLHYTIVTKSVMDIDAYTPPGNLSTNDTLTPETGGEFNPYVVHYIKETGELVLSDAAAATFKDGTTITYHKQDYQKGELNPLVYFDCIEVLSSTPMEPISFSLQPPIDLNTGAFTFAAEKLTAGVSDGIYPMLDSPTWGPMIHITNASGYDQSFQLWDALGSAAGMASATYTGTVESAGPPPMWESIFEVKDGDIELNIIQRVSIVDNNYKIDYALVNYGSEEINVDFMQHMNTAVAGDSNPLYSGNNTAMQLSESDAVIKLQSNDPDEKMIGVVTFLADSTANAPSWVNIGDDVTSAVFDPAYAASGAMTDSAYTLVWSGIALPPDGQYLMSSAYGVADNEVESSLQGGDSFNMDNQNIQYEFDTNTLITINSQAKNVYTDKMYADLLRLVEFAETLTLSDAKVLEDYYRNPPHNLTGDDLQNAVDSQITEEKAKMNAVLYDRFNNMLYLLDRHASNATKEHTQIGSRMQRLELLQSRLEEDEAAYTKLLSENEDTDMVKAIILKSAAEAAYQASLQVGSSVIQLTLANFIG